MSVAISLRTLIENWIERFNAADADGLAALYHEDAINHQVANEPVEGKEHIRAMFARELATAKLVCIVEQILEDAPWVILEWKDPLGLRGCGFFKVEDGLIRFQRGYWDKLSFLRKHNLPIEVVSAAAPQPAGWLTSPSAGAVAAARCLRSRAWPWASVVSVQSASCMR